MKETIKIIFVNYNTYEDLENCIESLFHNNKGLFNLEIVVVDNNSKKEIVNELERFCLLKNVHLIKNEENLGFAKANNIGLQYIQEENSDNSFIWFLNNDTKVEAGFFERLKENLPKINEAVYFEMRNFNNEFVNNGLNYVSLKTGRYSESIKKGYIPYIVGASIFLRNSEFIPKWDEDYFLYYEDVEYSISLKKNNYILKKIPNMYYLHKINGSSGCNPKTNVFRIRSQKRFMKKNGRCFIHYYIMKVMYYLVRFQFTELTAFLK